MRARFPIAFSGAIESTPAGILSPAGGRFSFVARSALPFRATL